LNFGVCFFQYEEESVKLEPELVGLAPLLMKNNEEAASIQSVLHQLHAIQRERINIMEKEEKEKVARHLSYGAGAAKIFIGSIQCL
jgi:uncharacterized protein YueI